MYFYFDSSVSGSWDDVFVVKVDDIDGGPVAHEHAAQADVSGGGHVPHCDGAIFRACNHQAVTETQVKDRLVVVDQSVQNLTGIRIPNPETVWEKQKESIVFKSVTKS